MTFLQMKVTIPPSPNNNVIRVFRDELLPFLDECFYVKNIGLQKIKYCYNLDSQQKIPSDFGPPPRFFGQCGLGYDQYAFYLGITFKPQSDIIMYQINQINYIDAVGLNDDDASNQFRVVTTIDDMDTEWNPKNPWRVNNDDVDCYGPLKPIEKPPEVLDYAEFLQTRKNPYQKKIIQRVFLQDQLDPRLPGFVSLDTGHVGVYRLDKQTSQTVSGDGAIPGECLDTYLTAILYKTLGKPNCDDPGALSFNYGIMRIAVPKCFMPSDVCLPYANYDVQYFSVGAHQCCNKDSKLLPFWTVNAKMLKKIQKKDEPYAYVFFAPQGQVRSRMTDENQTVPPLIDWGDRKGYLLETPSYAFIFRYKVPNPEWPGSPSHATCYDTVATSKPVGDELIGPDGVNWCPSIYGDNFDSIDAMIAAPFIGSVGKDSVWPNNQSLTKNNYN